MTDTKYMAMDEARDLVRSIAHSDVFMNIGDIELGIGRDEDGRQNYTVRADGDEDGLALETSAAKDLLRLLGIPNGAVKEFSDNPRLLDQMVEHCRKKRATQPIRIVRVGGKVIAIEDGSGVSLTLSEVWKAIESLDAPLGIHQLTHSYGHFEVRVVAGFNDQPVSDVDDVSHGGVCIGVNGSVQVQPYVYRLVCTNGMQCAQDLANLLAEKNESKDGYFERFQGTLEFAYRISQQALKKFVDTDLKVIDNPTKYLLRLMEMEGIPDTHQAKLLKRLEEECPRSTLYELVNMVTKYGRETEKPRLRKRFEVFGSTVAESAGGIRCNTCHTVL